MVDWTKKRTWKERILVDFAFHRQKKLLSRWNLTKLTKKLKTSEISLKNDVDPHLMVTCIGNAYLPTASRWTTADTREKLIQPTFARMNYHLQSGLFPSFTFSAHTMLHYNWIAQDYPELFTFIQDFQRKELWEITGGSWGNHNWTAVSGSSIAHHFLLGQRFNAKHFQQCASVGWVDGVDFLPQSTPQFLQKSGLTSIYCSSPISHLSRNQEPFPFLHWVWQAPDGTRLLASRSNISGDFVSYLPFLSQTNLCIFPDSQPMPFSNFKPPNLEDSEDHPFSESIIPLLASPFGSGGSTFGLSSDAIMEKSLWEEAGYVALGTAKSHFNKLTKFERMLPSWKDEIFLQSESYNLTVVGLIKENNHTAEILLDQAEALSVISGLLGGDHYQDELTRDWENVLVYQDSQIFSGKSLMEVYRGSLLKYKSIFAHLGSCQESAIMHSAHLLKTKIKEDSYTIFNAVGWPRDGYATILRRNYNQARSAANSPLMIQNVSFSPYVINRESHLGIQTPAGSALSTSPLSFHKKIPQLTQKSAQESTFNNENIMDMEFDIPLFDEDSQTADPFEKENEKNRSSSRVILPTNPEDKLLVYIPPEDSVPSFGISHLIFSETSGLSSKTLDGFSETHTEWVFRNPALCLKITKASGNIMHFSLNPNSTNLLGPLGIGYALYTIPTPSRIGKPKVEKDSLVLKPPLHIEAIEIIERGPLRYTFLITYRPTKARTVISTRISIYHQSHMIYGETLVDMHDTNMLLALGVDTLLSPKELYCGGPLCVHRRSISGTSNIPSSFVEFPFQEFVYWTGGDSASDNYDKTSTVGVYFQSKFGMSISESIPRFHLVASKPLLKPDATVSFSDSNVKTGKNESDQGYHRIPWAIEFLPTPTPVSTIMRKAYEYNSPFVLAPTHAIHSTQSFFSMDSPNVLIVSVKEIEEFMREAPDWFYEPAMAELAFIIKCVEVDGIETPCSIHLNSLFSLKQAMEVDFIERISHNGIQTSDVTLSGHTVKFTIRPHEMKAILIIGRIILEQE